MSNQELNRTKIKIRGGGPMTNSKNTLRVVASVLSSSAHVGGDYLGIRIVRLKSPCEQLVDVLQTINPWVGK